MACYNLFDEVLSDEYDSELSDLEQIAISACEGNINLYSETKERWMEDHMPNINSDLTVEFYMYLLVNYSDIVYTISPFILNKIIKMWFISLDPLVDYTIYIIKNGITLSILQDNEGVILETIENF